MLNLRMYTVILQTHVIQFLLALLPAMVSSTLHYEHSYAPAHEYKNHDYSFSYGVKDLHSGDVKQQWEKKEGDTVKGSYSLIEPDGRVRIVDYHADKENGFTATVKHKGVAKHPVDKHAQGYSADHEDDKPISHNEFNIKPGTPVVHYNHATTNSEDTSSYYAKDTHDPAKYEIKYFYPSEVKKYQEALAAQQQYYQSRDAHPVTEEQEEGGDEQEQEEGEQHGNESQEKQVHYYIPQTFESNEGKSEKNTNIPQAYLDASETQLQPQSIPLDLTYVKQAGSAQTPIGTWQANRQSRKGP
ncbi:uncharacterized protein LOC108734997 [Agrilus planipennis]|uniref:Uncharacterized protein LOC108734997 n=1 Tax=Agrilus planipennis TaxID=224129 RepID=A0A1W4WEB4_AGRPL|nr:uncharacterized protein LOC108734997 [Agrilus planipennis]